MLVLIHLDTKHRVANHLSQINATPRWTTFILEIKMDWLVMIPCALVIHAYVIDHLDFFRFCADVFCTRIVGKKIAKTVLAIPIVLIRSAFIIVWTCTANPMAWDMLHNIMWHMSMFFCG